ncbi:MAG TPA: RtcB family protein [Thermoanaerobaculia bacterium]|nr:RtcB family protein [Thermoanaerobaculia bacterium]
MRREAKGYRLLETSGVPVKAWTLGVSCDPAAERQLANAASLPIVFRWIAAMPDVHVGIGATVGAVIPTVEAIIPAAVGVDIGCGMAASLTSLTANDLPSSLAPLRAAIETAVPHGRTDSGGRNDRGAWHDPPARIGEAWRALEPGWRAILDARPELDRGNHPARHLGTLGTGNHFIEVCLDEADRVWLLLHSGSRGVGNRIGTDYIEIAREEMRVHQRNLPDRDLAWLTEGTESFDDYAAAVSWAQEYARTNRELMLVAIEEALASVPSLPPFATRVLAVSCHHNYVRRERHYGREVWITRKGAVRAGKGELGIVPGSMGARSFIVRGLGNPESFESCSHGAGRLLSRTEARRRFTLADHAEATAGVECRKDEAVLDETPAAYKPIDAVMNAQKDLVEVLHTLKQVVCVKG